MEIKIGKFKILNIESNGYSLGLLPGCDISAEIALRPAMGITVDDVARVIAVAAMEWTPEVIAAVAPVQIVKTQSAIFNDAEIAVQKMLDDLAKLWGYDDSRSAVSYIGDPNVQFNAEAISIRDWRSYVWTKCYTDMNAIVAGTMVMPISINAWITTMPIQPTRP